MERDVWRSSQATDLPSEELVKQKSGFSSGLVQHPHLFASRSSTSLPLPTGFGEEASSKK